jgi:hypothetical protein
MTLPLRCSLSRVGVSLRIPWVVTYTIGVVSVSLLCGDFCIFPPKRCTRGEYAKIPKWKGLRYVAFTRFLPDEAFQQGV